MALGGSRGVLLSTSVKCLMKFLSVYRSIVLLWRIHKPYLLNFSAMREELPDVHGVQILGTKIER